MHTHRVKTQTTRCFQGAVDSRRPDPRAHGCITLHQTCSCGATRAVNVNQGWREAGRWTGGK